MNINNGILEVSWTIMKAQIAAKALSFSYLQDDQEDFYHVWMTDGVITFHATVSGSDKTEFDSSYAAKANKPSVYTQNIIPTSALVLISHNLCDKLSWWYDSKMVKDESLSQDGVDNKKWTAAHQSIIDLEHGRVFYEDDIAGTALSVTPYSHGTKFSSTSGEHFLIPVCKVYNADSSLNSTLTRVDDTVPAAGKYRIDYANGFIVCGDDWTGKTIKFSYHYAQTSLYEFAPAAGKQLLLGHTEANAKNVQWDSASNPTVLFEVATGNTINSRRIYKNATDYIVQSVGAPQVWQDFSIIQWPYLVVQPLGRSSHIKLKSSLGQKIRLLHADDSQVWTKLDDANPTQALVVALYFASETES